MRVALAACKEAWVGKTRS